MNRSWIRNVFSRPYTCTIRKASPQLRLALEALEDRWVPSTFTVSNIADSGPGSLRAAVGSANSTAGPDMIQFDSSFNTPQTIALTSGQLELTDTSGATSIIGPAGGVTVSAGGLSRVFQVDDLVEASISGLTITGGTVGYDYGGGLFNLGTATLTNCTVSGNSAGFGGGGVSTGSYYNRGATTTLINCTVSGNTGGGLFTYFGTSTLINTIVAGNDFDLSGSLTDASTNNLIGGNPVLASLGNYGGTGETMALLPGSPAIDAGTSTGAPATDERGLPRVGPVDIGAFESSGFTIAMTSGSGQSASGAFADPLVATVAANNSIEPVTGGLVTFTPPASGASATISGSPALISASGEASVTAASNFIGGSYIVSATAAGAAGAASFSLTNFAVTSIAVSPGNPSLAVGVSAQFAAEGTFTDGSTQDITNAVAWASGTPSVATIGGTGLATAVAVGSTKITASFTGITSPADTLTVIAPSFVVNTTADAFGFYSGTTSLREAIASANVVPGRTIVFDKKVFQTPQTITLTGGQLELSDTTGTTTIIGPAAGVTVSGNNANRVFQVDPNVTASISGLTIASGNAGIYGNGGGLLNLGMATLTNCTVSGNTAGTIGISYYGGGNGGGVANLGTATLTSCTITGNSASAGYFSFGGGYGGGVYNAGTATLNKCTVSGNTSGGGGAVQTDAQFSNGTATTTLSDCTVNGNTGGGVSNFGTTTLNKCTVSGNSGIGVLSAAALFPAPGVASVTTLTNCTVSGNSGVGVLTGASGIAFFGNYGIYYYVRQGASNLANCTVSGNSGGGLATRGGTTTATNTTIRNNTTSLDGGGVLTSGFFFGSKVYGTTNLTNCTVSGNTAGRDGGGLATTALGKTMATKTTISGNTAGRDGGGLSIVGSHSSRNGDLPAAASLTNCTVSGNTAARNGGGLSNAGLGTTTVTGTNVKNNSAVAGGGIANQGTLNVASSNILNNTATSKGGGISTTGGTATITNSVINTNRVDSLFAALGGGIDCENSTLSLNNCTVNANQANGATALGGGIYALDSTVSVKNSTVNGNKAKGAVDGEGGGIYSLDSILTLIASNVKGNKASTAFDDIFAGP